MVSRLFMCTIAVSLLATQTFSGTTLTASSGQSNYLPSFAMDGKMDTRWASLSSDKEWLLIEFDKPVEIVGLNIHWETAYGRDYDIEILSEKEKWVSVSQVRNSDGGIDAIYFGLQKTKALRFIGIRRGTGWGYSIWDIKLLGPDQQRTAKASDCANGTSANNVMDGQKETFWECDPSASGPITLELASPQPIEIGGLRMEWAQEYACPCLIQYFSNETGQWKTVMDKKGGVSSTEDIFFKTILASKLRLVFPKLDKPFRIAEIQLKQPSESWTPIRHFEMLAQRLPDGLFPGWLRREQAFWTVTGLPGSFNESLLEEYGKVESGLRNFSVTPALLIDGKLTTAKSFNLKQTLADNWIPIPSVQWKNEQLTLDITANTIEPDTTLVLYKLKNTGKTTLDLSLLFAVRPLPINPPWQHGGFRPIKKMQWTGQDTALLINDKKAMTFYPKPPLVSLHSQTQDAEAIDITEQLISQTTSSDSVSSEEGMACAGMRYDYSIKPGQSKTVLAVYPNADVSDITISENPESFFQKEMEKSSASWSKLIGNWEINLPNQKLVDLIRSNLAYLCINADGPATQPGSRNYNSSWIRDGAISATAMMRFGLSSQGKDYLEWFTGLIKDDGFVPFLVDTKTGNMEGFANNWREYDSFGEYVFLVRQITEIANDNTIAKQCWPKVKAAMEHMEKLINQRRTEKYKGTEYEGILPESQSHEGYIDPPRHSYWDDFFAVKGIQDARALAIRLGHNEDAKWLAGFEKDFRASLLASIEKVRKRDGLSTLPACAELGDFDPTSTSIGIMVADERDTLPQDALRNTYDRYMKESRHRASQPFGTRATYTPYEVRNISALIRLGRTEDALMLVDYFLEDAVRPLGWNHMAEVVHGDPRTPSYIGDMPHTWVGAGLINAIRDMLVYEERDALFLAAAIPDKWLDSGVSVKNLQTWWGPISYDLKRQGNGEIILELRSTRKPPNGFVLPKGVKLVIKN
jgi:F5/8 type C domain